MAVNSVAPPTRGWRICTDRIVAVVLAAPAASLACQFDTDCWSGGRCVKQEGHVDGVCLGGLNPGYDRQADREAAVERSNEDTLRGAAGVGGFIFGLLGAIADAQASDPPADDPDFLPDEYPRFEPDP